MDTIPFHYPDLVDLDGYSPPRYSTFGFVLNAKVLVEVFHKIPGDITRKSIRQAIESLAGLDIGNCRDIDFSPSDNKGMDEVYSNTVINGRIVPLTDWSVFAR